MKKILHRRRAFLALFALALAASAAFWFWGRRSTAPARQEAPAAAPAAHGDPDVLSYPQGASQLSMIRVQTVASSPLPFTEPLSARLAYDEDVTARIAVGFAGRIVALHAAPGDSVRAGQVLAEIDSPDYGTALADLNKARADAEHKRLAVERAKELVPGDAIPVKELEGLEADLAQAVAETARAQQRLKNMNPRGLVIEGQRLKLVSPIDGVVAERTATPALEVAPGMASPLFVVTDPRRLWLMIDLPEKLLSKIKRGNQVEVQSDAYPGERFPAQVVQLGQVVDTNTRRVTVRGRLDNTRRELMPEMFVRAQLLQDGGTGVRVPNEALVNQGIHAHVFVQTAPGQFQRRRVSLLTQGSDASYVRDGLQGGEQVVAAGALLLDAELSARAGSR